MSKKSASRHVGGQGLLRERKKEFESNLAAENAKKAELLLASAMRSEARELARRHSPSAVRILRKIMLDKTVAPNIRRLCALDLIELGEPPEAKGGARLVNNGNALTIVLAQRPGQLPVEIPVRTMPNEGADPRAPEKPDALDPADAIADAEIA